MKTFVKLISAVMAIAAVLSLAACSAGATGGGSTAESKVVRIGTPAVTARGFKEDEAREVGALLAMAATDFEANKDEIAQRVDALCRRFPLYE